MLQCNKAIIGTEPIDVKGFRGQTRKIIATHNKPVRKTRGFGRKCLRKWTKLKLELESEAEAVADRDQTQVHPPVV